MQLAHGRRLDRMRRTQRRHDRHRDREAVCTDGAALTLAIVVLVARRGLHLEVRGMMGFCAVKVGERGGRRLRGTAMGVTVEGERRQKGRRRNERREQELQEMAYAVAHVETIAELV